MATDFKFAIDCIQESAGSENAKLKVYKSDGTTNVLAETEITSTDRDNPTTVCFEVSGYEDIASDKYQSLVLELTNEYYVDSSTDRNIVVLNMRYVNKTGSDYKVPTGTGYGLRSNSTDNTDHAKWVPTLITDISGDDQDNSAFNNGNDVVVWSESKTTITFPTKHSSNDTTGYRTEAGGSIQT